MTIAITGTIIDSKGQPAAALVTFTPTSVPQFDGPELVDGDQVQVRTNPSDGTLPALSLEPGVYKVVIQSLGGGQVTLTITVPTSGGPFDLSQISGSPSIQPNPVWQPSGSGSPNGVVPGLPGWSYLDTANNAVYFKFTGTGNTGWQQVLQL